MAELTKAIVIEDDEVMDDTQLEEYTELVEALGTRAVRASKIISAVHLMRILTTLHESNHFLQRKS